MYWLALAVGSHWPKLRLFPPPESEPIFQFDKGLHFIAYAGLAWLMFRAKMAGRDAGVGRTALVVGCVGLLYAGLDELTQSWTDRQVTFSDFMASAMGVLAVVIWFVSDPEPVHARKLRACRVTLLVGSVIIIGLALIPAVNDVARWAVHQTPWPTLRMDTLGHFLIAMGMTWLLASSYPAGARRPRLGVWVTILVMGLSAPMIEWAQALTGRGVAMADVYAHELGLFAALVVWALISIGRALRADGITEPHA